MYYKVSFEKICFHVLSKIVPILNFIQIQNYVVACNTSVI